MMNGSDRPEANFDHRRHIFRLPGFQGPVDLAIRFFVETPVYRLLLPSQFVGAGVYGLYYTGDYELYAPIAALNKEACVHPIYIGKAVPAGWRTGRSIETETSVLYGRLKEHTRSLKQTHNLQVDDFLCRFMILSGAESDLIIPVEAELIRRYKPLWNSVIDGLGNHDPGKGRYDQAPSEWDILHPGRPWVRKLTGTPPDLNAIIATVRLFMEQLSLS